MELIFQMQQEIKTVFFNDMEKTYDATSVLATQYENISFQMNTPKWALKINRATKVILTVKFPSATYAIHDSQYNTS